MLKEIDAIACERLETALDHEQSQGNGAARTVPSDWARRGSA